MIIEYDVLDTNLFIKNIFYILKHAYFKTDQKSVFKILALIISYPRDLILGDFYILILQIIPPFYLNTRF